MDGTPVAATLNVFSVPNSWSEKTVTAANAPKTGSLVASLKPKTTDKTLTFNVSKVVNKAGTYAFALKSASTNAVTRLRSMEYGTATSGGPELVITTKKTTTTSAKPSTPATPPVTAPAECVTDALLVPSCGVLWGAAVGGFTDTPRDQALKDWEALTGRTASIYHTYHKGDEQFPTKAEIAMTQDPKNPRVLLLNWKVAYNSTWAKVAARRAGRPDRQVVGVRQEELPAEVLPRAAPRAGERRVHLGLVRHDGQGLRGDVPPRDHPPAGQRGHQRRQRDRVHG
nr:hypothetical protein GCM10020092_008930 [Actinoplanes digitatis]